MPTDTYVKILCQMITIWDNFQIYKFWEKNEFQNYYYSLNAKNWEIRNMEQCDICYLMFFFQVCMSR